MGCAFSCFQPLFSPLALQWARNLLFETPCPLFSGLFAQPRFYFLMMICSNLCLFFVAGYFRYFFRNHTYFINACTQNIRLSLKLFQNFPWKKHSGVSSSISLNLSCVTVRDSRLLSKYGLEAISVHPMIALGRSVFNWE